MEVNLKQPRTWSCLIFTHLAGHQNFDDLYVRVQAWFTTGDGNRSKNETTSQVTPLGWFYVCWLKPEGN